MKFLKRFKYIVFFALFTVSFLQRTDCMKVFIKGKKDQIVTIWNLKTLRYEKVFEDFGNLIAVSQDGKKRLYAEESLDGNEERVIKVLDVKRNRYKKNVTKAKSTDILLSPDGEKIIAILGRIIEFIDVRFGNVIKKDLHQEIPDSELDIEQTSFSQDGKRVAAPVTSRHEKAIIIWGLESNTDIKKVRKLNLEDYSTSIRLSKSGKKLAALVNNTIIWDVKTGGALNVLKGNFLPLFYNVGIAFLRFSPDEKKVVFLAPQKRATIFDIKTGNIDRESEKEFDIMFFETSFGEEASFSKDGRRIFLRCHSPRVVVIWDVKNNSYKEVLKGHMKSHDFVHFFSDSEDEDKAKRERLSFLEKKLGGRVKELFAYETTQKGDIKRQAYKRK